MSHQVKEHVSYLLSSEGGSLFRLYLPDCGLFVLQSEIYPETFLDPTKQNPLSGVFMENFAAEELTSRGHPLFYWKGKTSSELEFLIMDRGNIIPIDGKKNKGSLDSLEKYREHNRNDLAIKASANRYEYDEKNKLLALPFYYFPFYFDDIEKYRYKEIFLITKTSILPFRMLLFLSWLINRPNLLQFLYPSRQVLFELTDVIPVDKTVVDF